jgi:D-alanyl-D-alanine dipeptidase
LLLWDGYRPQRAVDCFLRWSHQREDGRTKARYFPNIDRREILEHGYVAVKSGHTRGSAVDLTLYDLATGELAPMGGSHDLMDPISHHGAQGITPAEAKNRQCLSSLMRHCGFDRYDCEWWHYTLKDEPYPDTYFDFPIT